MELFVVLGIVTVAAAWSLRKAFAGAAACGSSGRSRSTCGSCGGCSDLVQLGGRRPGGRGEGA